jgi:CBS domain-containing protein
MATIQDVMTPNPVCADANATLREIAGKMLDVDTGIIPLLENDRLFGVITDRDLVIRAIAWGVNPEQAQARDYCTTHVDTVSPQTSVEEAIEHMETRQIRRLVVCEKDRIVGVVSLGDLAETVSDQAEAVLVEVSKSERTLAHKR